MPPNLILGEPADEIHAALVRLDVQVRDNVPAALSEKIEAEGALLRALLRAEAELRAAEAVAGQTDSREARTPDQRRADALMLIIHRMAEQARAA